MIENRLIDELIIIEVINSQFVLFISNKAFSFYLPKPFLCYQLTPLSFLPGRSPTAKAALACGIKWFSAMVHTVL
jgi:hypothetical protein